MTRKERKLKDNTAYKEIKLEVPKNPERRKSQFGSLFKGIYLEILDEFHENGSVYYTNLCSKLNRSSTTIHKSLKELEAQCILNHEWELSADSKRPRAVKKYKLSKDGEWILKLFEKVLYSK